MTLFKHANATNGGKNGTQRHNSNMAKDAWPTVAQLIDYDIDPESVVLVRASTSSSGANIFLGSKLPNGKYPPLGFPDGNIITLREIKGTSAKSVDRVCVYLSTGQELGRVLRDEGITNPSWFHKSMTCIGIIPSTNIKARMNE